MASRRPAESVHGEPAAAGGAQEDLQAAERAVLAAAALGLGVGVVAPSIWADLPWMAGPDSSMWVWIIFVVPPVAALVGAVRACWKLPGSVLWVATTLDIVIAVFTPLGAIWGVGPGAVSALFLVVAGFVLWDDRPGQWQLVGWGALALAVSLFGTMGFVAHLVPDGWWAPAASVLNLVALAIVIRRALLTRRGDSGRLDQPRTQVLPTGTRPRR